MMVNMKLKAGLTPATQCQLLTVDVKHEICYQIKSGCFGRLGVISVFQWTALQKHETHADCLSSIRFKKKKKTFPVLGNLHQKCYFVNFSRIINCLSIVKA